jgi:hypothetical protein
MGAMQRAVLNVLTRLWAWMRTGTATRLPVSLVSGMGSVDGILEKKRSGGDVSVSDLEGCSGVHSRLYDIYAARSGTSSNVAFREEDRATLFVLSTKLAALQDPRHDAWPMLASLRAAAHPALRRRVVGKSDEWTRLAALFAALSVGDMVCAQTCFEAIRADPFLLSLVREWAWEMTIGYAYADPKGHATRFLDACGLPREPQTSVQKPLHAGQRWALSAIIYPSYARDQRVDLTPAWSWSSCRIMLSDTWRIRNAEEARRQMSSLLEGGNEDALARVLAKLDGPTFTSDPKLDLLEARRGEFEAHGLLAWDVCRMMQVARTAYGARYITEDEAWAWLMEGARALRAEYGSWAAMADDYLLGTRFVSKRGTEEPHHAGAIGWMRSSAESPWLAIPWEIDFALLHADPENQQH